MKDIVEEVEARFKELTSKLDVVFAIAITIIVVSLVCIFLTIYGIRNDSTCDDGKCPDNTEAHYTLSDECYCVIPNENNKKK